MHFYVDCKPVPGPHGLQDAASKLGHGSLTLVEIDHGDMSRGRCTHAGRDQIMNLINNNVLMYEPKKK